MVSVLFGPGLFPLFRDPSLLFSLGVAAGADLSLRLDEAAGLLEDEAEVLPKGVLAAVVLAELMSEPEPNLTDDLNFF